MLKLTIYTRFPAVVADLIESHYKHIVLPPAAKIIRPIEVGEDRLEFPYAYAGQFLDDPLETWMRWAKNCGLIRSSKLEKVQEHSRLDEITHIADEAGLYD